MFDELADRAEWRDEFLLSRHIREVGDQSRHYREASRGDLIQVARGVYIKDAGKVTDDAAYLSRIRGRSLAAHAEPLFSHFSAARIWGLPVIGAWPDDVDIEVGDARNGRSIPGLRRHRAGSRPSVTRRGGLLVTSLARTVADVASVSSLRTAVAIIDSALAGLQTKEQGIIRPPLSKDALLAELEHRGTGRGTRQLSWAIGFGDGLAASPGESVSRLTMHEIGCPAPVLQQSFYDHGEFVATTDFWWPEFNLTGEFDGHGKYLRDQYTRGRPTAEIVVAEKIREDKLRALGPGMSRWVWREALSPQELRKKLSRAGLPCAR